jgi:hypothetical protein
VKFIKAKAFEILITALLTVLTGIGIYLVRKIESCEIRVWSIETSNPAITERFNTLEAKIDGANTRIDDVKELVIELLKKATETVSHVAERGPDDGFRTVTEQRGGSP